jgi:vacuolar-type H+-ATPase subunit E/Vma4
MDKVSEKIYVDAEEKIKAIERESAIEIERIKKKQKSEIAEYKKKHNERLGLMKHEQLQRIEAEIEISNRNQLLGKKRELLKRLRESVIKRFSEDENLYKKYLLKVISTVVVTGSEKIYLKTFDQERYKDFLLTEFNKLNSELKIEKKMFVENQKLFVEQNGIVIADGKIIYDGRLETEIEKSVNKLEVPLAQLIFQ